MLNELSALTWLERLRIVVVQCSLSWACATVARNSAKERLKSQQREASGGDHTYSLYGETFLLSKGFELATLFLFALARKDTMNTITIDLSPETYKRLEEQARRAGQAVEVLSRELLEAALKSSEEAHPRTTREVLRAAGCTRPLSETLRSKILPGVTLDEVRAILEYAAGPSLSDIIQEQRGRMA